MNRKQVAYVKVGNTSESNKNLTMQPLLGVAVPQKFIKNGMAVSFQSKKQFVFFVQHIVFCLPKCVEPFSNIVFRKKQIVFRNSNIVFRRQQNVFCNPKIVFCVHNIVFPRQHIAERKKQFVFSFPDIVFFNKQCVFLQKKTGLVNQHRRDGACYSAFHPGHGPRYPQPATAMGKKILSGLLASHKINSVFGFSRMCLHRAPSPIHKPLKNNSIL